jgi:hypothetical protein
MSVSTGSSLVGSSGNPFVRSGYFGPFLITVAAAKDKPRSRLIEMGARLSATGPGFDPCTDIPTSSIRVGLPPPTSVFSASRATFWL